MATNRRFVLGVDLDGVCADFYRGLRPIAAEWLGVDVATLPERVSWGLPEWGIDNVAGNVLNGREEFEKLQTRTHATQFKDSVRTVTGTEINFLTPDIAVAHIKWGMRGDRDADGTARSPRDGVMMQVLVKRGGAWTIVAVQNTNVR
jgi:uncharacterized protein (TIGR02246 family)